jgi:hypothetical protein
MNEEQKRPEANEQARAEEVAAYEKLRQHVKEALANARQRVSADTMQQAVETGAEKLKRV